MRVHIKTFGCRLNQYESESINYALTEKNIQTSENLPAEIVIVNSCTVTHKSDSKLRKYINSLLKDKNVKLVILSGCYASVQDEIEDKKILIVKNEDKSKIASIIEAYIKDQKISKKIEDFEQFRFLSIDYKKHSRAFLKIQDGCSHFCNYCIVSRARGIPKSISAKEVLNAVKEIRKLGFEEIVLSGINLGSYKSEGYSLSDLTEEMISNPNSPRIRFSSIEPVYFNDKMISLFRSEKISAHAHIPLQSASINVLKKMGRRYTKEDYKNIIKKLRKVRPRISLTTDVMVGHPGESENDFIQTYDFLKENAFASLHVFRYSKRPNTPSAEMPEQIDEKVKQTRSKKLIKLNSLLLENYSKDMLGKEVFVVCEKQSEKGFYGIASEYMHFNVISNKTHEKRRIYKALFFKRENGINYGRII